MFYSHEILTSPEHGVATIWLVATLGSKSVTRKVNKKAILDVDVPRACNVIMEPEAPMALRLQGSLLYGVSRVYNQQCGYTLTDVQAMHDKMRAMLRSIPGGGLDPMAGKARPEQLILPYDPSFMPEINVPGLGIDLSRFNITTEASSTQQSSIACVRTPDISQSALSQNARLQLDLSPGGYMQDFGGYASGTDMSGSVQRIGHFGRISTLGLGEEEGVLLQPDFEFDEDGNIIELDAKHQERENRASRPMSESPLTGEVRGSGDYDFSWDLQPMLVDEDPGIAIQDEGNNFSTNTQPTRQNHTSDSESIVEVENATESNQATMRQRRNIKFIVADNQIALRNTELAQLNNEYVRNMAAAFKQKQQNKIPTQAKKNAVFWVFGQGIGSVGVGMGASRAPHPLSLFSGEELYATLHPETHKGKKRSHSSDGEKDPKSEGRRVRRREDEEDQVGRGLLQDDDVMQDDVEIGRHASSALRDDHSSLMPWNITASIKNSQHGSSAAKAFRGFGSVSDLSSRGLPDSVGYGRSRSRLTSASPLAGRGFPYDLEELSSLSIPGNDDDMGMFGDLDLSEYLHTDVDQDHHAEIGNGTGGPAIGKQRAMKAKLLKSNLNQESLNFLDFMTTQMETFPEENDTQSNGPSTPRRQTSSRLDKIALSALLPPRTTSRSVATHGLMHILTLATKGFLDVHQEPYEDLSSKENGAQYRYGEIFVRLSGM